MTTTYHDCRLCEKVTGCVPWFLPRHPHHAVCDPWQQRLFATALDNNTNHELKDCDCLPDCRYTEYQVTAAGAEFRSN